MKIILLDQTNWTDILTAIGTVGTVLISLGLLFYKEWWEPKWCKARLRVSIDRTYSFAIDTTWDALMNKANEEMFTAAKIRLRVEHTRGNPAKNVEVFVTKVWDMKDGEKKQNGHFFPANLLWSGKMGQQTIRADFAGSTVRFCDLGIYGSNPDNYGWEFHVAISDFKGDPAVEKFSNILIAGVYELELLVTGENVEPSTSLWRLELSGDWSDKEEIMFSKHIKVRKIRE